MQQRDEDAHNSQRLGHQNVPPPELAFRLVPTRSYHPLAQVFRPGLSRYLNLRVTSSMMIDVLRIIYKDYIAVKYRRYTAERYFLQVTMFNVPRY